MDKKQLERKLILMRELRKKETQSLCQNNFYAFCMYMDSDFFTIGKPHLKMIADALQEVADGVLLKLAISMPPRAGKSYITSLFCAWILGKFPTGSIMRNSYAAKLAEKFSKDIRDGILINNRFKDIFPGITVGGQIDNWSINGRAQTSYFCAGVGGPILGFGCNKIAILDDPIKNIEEALSETVIENTWNWYTSTHLSRLESGCAEIHIATRWSRKDPIGRLTDEYSEEYSKDFKVINIPAINDEGNSFCEEIKTTEEYKDIRKITDEFIWEAEYMQHPVESKGLLFPIEELNRFSMSELMTLDKEGNKIIKPADGIVGFTDTADKGSDFLSSPIGRKYGKYTYVTDILFTQDGVEITEPLVAQLIIDTGCEVMKIESNNGGSSFARNVRALIEDKSPCSVIDEMTTQNKETRILMTAGYIKEYFYFREDYETGSDYDKFMRQFTSYMKMGKNKHDDGADSIEGLGSYMKLMDFTKEEPKKKSTLWMFNTEEKERGYIEW